MNDRVHGVADAFAELVSAMNGDAQSPLGVLDLVVARAPTVVAGTRHALVVRSDGPQLLQRHPAAPAETTSWIVDLHNEVGEGPLLDALHGAEHIQLTDLSIEQRWPRFRGRARAGTLGAVLCGPLVVDSKPFGALGLLGGPDAFDDGAAALCRVLCVQTSVALSRISLRENMQAALLTRDVIGQAKGILMERFKITADAAFAFLARTSQDSNTKLRGVCEQLCLTGMLPGAPKTTHRQPHSPDVRTDDLSTGR